jgi:hypothetical protein
MDYAWEYSGHLDVITTVHVDNLDPDVISDELGFVTNQGQIVGLFIDDSLVTAPDDIRNELITLIYYLRETDPTATIRGTLYWKGDSSEDRGYLKIDGTDISVYMCLDIYVHENDYETVVDLVNNYLENDLKEVVREALYDTK